MAKFRHDVKLKKKDGLGKSRTVQVGSAVIVFDKDGIAKDVPTVSLPYFRNAPKLFQVTSTPLKG